MKEMRCPLGLRRALRRAVPLIILILKYLSNVFHSFNLFSIRRYVHYAPNVLLVAGALFMISSLGVLGLCG